VSGGTTSKSTLKQTMRLTFSELDQLVTSFMYCFDNEMRSWCGGLAAGGSDSLPTLNASLGPTLKRLNGPLDQFSNVSEDERILFVYFVLILS